MVPLHQLYSELEDQQAAPHVIFYSGAKYVPLFSLDSLFFFSALFLYWSVHPLNGMHQVNQSLCHQFLQYFILE